MKLLTARRLVHALLFLKTNKSRQMQKLLFITRKLADATLSFSTEMTDSCKKFANLVEITNEHDENGEIGRSGSELRGHLG